MVMRRTLRGRTVMVVVIVIPIPGERMMHAAIRDPAMLQSHMPGGKEPAEQKQKGEETLVHAQGVTYWGGRLVLSTPYRSSSEALRSHSAFAMTETVLRLTAAPA